MSDNELGVLLGVLISVGIVAVVMLTMPMPPTRLRQPVQPPGFQILKVERNTARYFLQIAPEAITGK